MSIHKNRPFPSRRAVSMLAMLLLLAALPGIAFAASPGLPYEAGLSKLTESLTGPVAFAISVIGVVAAGAMLIFGGDMNGFMRSIVFLVLVIGLIVSASAILGKFFNKTGTFADVGAQLLQGIC